MPGPGGIGQPWVASADASGGSAMLRGGDNQTAVVYDLLSEGSIEGLKDGFSSIYFNGTPIIDPNSAAYKSLKSRRGTCTTTAKLNYIVYYYCTCADPSKQEPPQLQSGKKTKIYRKNYKKGF